jgi:hypothetical protein
MSVSSNKHILESYLMRNSPQLTYRVGVELSEGCHDVGFWGGFSVCRRRKFESRNFISVVGLSFLTSSLSGLVRS